jgi:hypothetical protein
MNVGVNEYDVCTVYIIYVLKKNAKIKHYKKKITGIQRTLTNVNI